MSVTDELISSNSEYAASFNQKGLPMPPSRKVAIVACMDARLDVYRLLGLKLGEAHVIRNAGGSFGNAAVERFLGAGFTQQNVLEVVLGVSLETLGNYANHIAETPLDHELASFESKAA